MVADSLLAISGFGLNPSLRRPDAIGSSICSSFLSPAQLLLTGRCAGHAIASSFSCSCCWEEYRHCHWHRRRTAAILYPTFHSLTALKTTVTRLRLRPAAASSPSPREDPLLPETMEGPPCYHPSEEIAEEQPLLQEDARLTDAEMSRTIVEMNSKATLILSGVIDDEVRENILWPELSYLTDEHGGIYIVVNTEEDILQNLTSNDNIVQVLIGLDSIERIAEVELSVSSGIHFGTEEIGGEDYDSDDDDFEQDLVVISEDDEDDEGNEDDHLFDDWESMDTMHSSHPMYFARKITEVVSDAKLDWMDPPSIGLVIQGLIRPAFAEEHSIVQEKNLDEKGDKHEGLQSGTIFYKVELINIQLVSAYGNLSLVKVQDYRQAQPDVIAHSKTKIISRLKSGGEKTTQALKSLCWRIKGIQVEEVDLTGVDSLGFDLRVCSGTQIQNLRFAFKIRATSECSAERQLRDLLFPRVQQKQQEWRQAHQKES